MSGGTGSNVVMPSLYGLLECRTHDKPFRLEILERWRAAFRAAVDSANAEAAEGVGPASVEFTQEPIYDPYELAEDAPVVAAAAEAMKIPLALNDPKGKWTIRAKDVATGMTAEATFEVK